MIETLVKMCGIAVLCSVSLAALGGALGGMATALKLGGLALIMGSAVALIGYLVNEISVLGDTAEASEYASLMLKALGISAVCRICSDVCRDCGATSLGEAALTVGKLTLVALSVPKLLELVSFARGILEKI